MIGQLISRLRDLGAATVALDIMFAEPDRFEGPGPTPDESLAETLREGRVDPRLRDDVRRAARHGQLPCVLHPIGLAIMRRDDSTEEPFFQATGADLQPARPDARRRNASGFLNAAPDPDGLLRRIPVLIAARRPRLSEPRR